MRDSEVQEFADFTDLIAEHYPHFLQFVFDKSYFFKIYLDSKRYNLSKPQI
ncbi:Replication-associated protein [Lactococcus lactis subsp. lactis]|nr:Replication-associated protein [Lactococcus lactis subsp. lactis]